MPSSVAPLAWLGAWVFMNMSAHFMNRIIFTDLGFRFPILLTLIHKVVFVSLYLALCWLRLAEFQRITWARYVRAIVPASLAVCGTVLFNNMALSLVDVAVRPFPRFLVPYLFSFSRPHMTRPPSIRTTR